jgi:1,4-dihydroxy-2-naphthoate octaprenyltransferase
VAGAVGVGLIACALLVVNNLRDVATDEVAGKRTLAVRLGAPGTRRLYAGMLAGAALMVLVAALTRPFALIALLATALAAAPLRAVLGGAEGRALLPVLRDTGRLELAYGVLFGLGLALSA